MKIDIEKAASHLAGAIRFKTISHPDQERYDRREFLGLHDYLRRTYPKLHRTLKREAVNDLSLLYTWKGARKDAEPILLMSHLDVVPVERDAGSAWTHPPFSGDIDGGYIWGRGALDVKNGVIGILEAVEGLVSSGFRPGRTLYLAFGHDEEVLGDRGAAEISRILAGRGVRFVYTLDEGGFIRDTVIPGLAKPAALIGIAEKGYLSLELTAGDAGGHASTPPRRTAAGRIAAAVCRLEAHRFPARLTQPVKSMFETLGAEATAFYRTIYTNLRFFAPFLLRRLSASPQADAMIRTTIAPTMLEGSTQENVLPRKARAVVNLRIPPGDSGAGVIARVRKIINDPEIVITARRNASEPSPISSTESMEYAALKETIMALFPDVVVAPFLMVGATDSRHFTAISRQVLRFIPGRIGSEDMARVHGVDERIGIDNFSSIIAFYAELIRRTAG